MPQYKAQDAVQQYIFKYFFKKFNFKQKFGWVTLVVISKKCDQVFIPNSKRFLLLPLWVANHLISFYCFDQVLMSILYQCKPGTQTESVAKLATGSMILTSKAKAGKRGNRRTS